MQKLIILTLLLVSVCSYDLLQHSGTKSSAAFNADDVLTTDSITLDTPVLPTEVTSYTFSFWAKIGTLPVAADIDAVNVDFFSLSSSSADNDNINIGIQYETTADELIFNYVALSTAVRRNLVAGAGDQEIVLTGESAFADFAYWTLFYLRVEYVLADTEFTLEVGYNDTTAVVLDIGTGFDATGIHSLDTVDFTTTSYGIEFDGFRQYEGALTSAEIESAVFCGATETTDYYYGEECDYAPPVITVTASGQFLYISFIVMILLISILF